MGKLQYQNKLDILLDEISILKTKPSLLLHACCGPCSSYVLEYLAKIFNITVYFYNPNIYPQEEYYRRLEELKLFYKQFPIVIDNGVDLIETDYNPVDFFNAIKIDENPELKNEGEKGERCRRCYEFRLKKCFEYGKNNKYDYFCTTLSISPFKDAEKINIIGESLEKGSVSGPKWLYSDFKKKGGFKRSLELSSEYNLYRQQYCGCIFSMNNHN